MSPPAYLWGDARGHLAPQRKEAQCMWLERGGGACLSSALVLERRLAWVLEDSTELGQCRSNGQLCFLEGVLTVPHGTPAPPGWRDQLGRRGCLQRPAAAAVCACSRPGLSHQPLPSAALAQGQAPRGGSWFSVRALLLERGMRSN